MSRSSDRQRRRGFTLTEVAISLLVVAVGVISVMLVLPLGVQTQTQSRNKVIASALALYLMDMAYNEPLPGFVSRYSFGTDGDGKLVTSVSGASPNYLIPDHHIHRPDLENQVCNWFHGVLPLPDTIAARLDSDQEEIREILGQGGKLYFFGPGGSWTARYSGGWKLSQTLAEWSQNTGGAALPAAEMQHDCQPVPYDIQRLVFAVVGYPQRNAEVLYDNGKFPSYGTTRPIMAGYPVPANQPSLALINPTLPNALEAEPVARCRQIVFWAVDWYSYSDCELSPAAGLDRYKRMWNVPSDSGRYWWWDHLLRMPGRAYFLGMQRERVDNGGWMMSEGQRTDKVRIGPCLTDLSSNLGSTPLGLGGGDWNGNSILDRGTVAPNVRLRAKTVARFNYYDPRVWLTLNRNPAKNPN